MPPQLGQEGGPEYASKSTAVGGGGLEAWTFAGKASGEGLLKLK